jgi:dTDP-4-amino-4,6-dideoxygalactose transaminase
MYEAGQMQCVSFTGQYKHLKLGKGGAILLDNKEAYEWMKKMRNSGRNECSYHVDSITVVGRNCYMHPSVALLGRQLIHQFYHIDGTPMDMEDTELPYPDLSDPKHTAFQ